VGDRLPRTEAITVATALVILRYVRDGSAGDESDQPVRRCTPEAAALFGMARVFMPESLVVAVASCAMATGQAAWCSTAWLTSRGADPVVHCVRWRSAP
jgi:hypothetical protein